MRINSSSFALGIWLAAGAAACGGEDGPVDDAGTNGGTNGATVNGGLDATLPDGGRDAGPDSSPGLDGSIADVTCEAGEVPCNGACLSAVGESEAGCTLLASGFEWWGGIAANSTKVFLGSFDTIDEFDLTSNQLSALVDEASVEAGLVASADELFAIVRTTSATAGVFDRDVIKVSATGVRTDLAVGVSDAERLSPQGNQLLYLADDGIYGVPTDGSSAPQLLQASTNVRRAFAADATALYFADDGVLTRYSPYDAASGEVLAATVTFGSAFVDDTNLYWRGNSTGEMQVGFVTLPKGDGSAEDWLVGEDVGTSFAMEDNHIYSNDDGLVSRVDVDARTVQRIARVGNPGDTVEITVSGGILYAARYAGADREEAALVKVTP